MRELSAVAIAILLAVLGCHDASDPQPYRPERVVYPSWLTPDLRALAQAEIDAAGVPDGWQVIVTVPIFETDASPTGLARGLCDFDAHRITVGWRARPWETTPCLPALAHEVQHAVTGDPLAGH